MYSKNLKSLNIYDLLYLPSLIVTK